MESLMYTLFVAAASQILFSEVEDKNKMLEQRTKFISDPNEIVS